jgi:hypothetical protein
MVLTNIPINVKEAETLWFRESLRTLGKKWGFRILGRKKNKVEFG